MESYDELLARHEREVAELGENVKTMLKGAKKSQRAELEARVIQMQFDLKATHREEEDEWEAKHGGEAPQHSAKSAAAAAAEESQRQRKVEEDLAKAKKEKAKKKHVRKELKEKVRDEMKKEIQEATAGLSQRDNENARIAEKLTAERLVVKPIISDGHCLYRSLSDQLHLNPDPPTSPHLSVAQLRQRAADYIRSHQDQFAPFLELEPDSAEMSAYCDNIVNEQKAEWGGQVEIQALCASLNRCIHVYSADAPVLRMGHSAVRSHAPPLRVSYHKHYYALGEHYNSVISLDDV